MSTVWSRSAIPVNAAIETNETREVASYPKWEGRILALFVLALSLFVGYQLVFHYHIVYGDAMSRALSGLYTVFRPSFHLAAVGFLWNPLPSLLSIPLALFRSLWPPITEYGFAANIISSCFAAVGVYHLNRILWRFGLGRTARVLWCLLYIANPMLLLYGGNGMTDGMMVAICVACADNVIGYLQTEELNRLIIAAVWLAAGFMVRYESVPIGAAMGVGLAFSVYRTNRNWRKAEAMLVTFWFPVVAAGITWILLNWIIMHNPLYFASSRYSNTVQLTSGSYNTPAVMAAKHHLSVALSQVIHFSILFWPYIPAALVVLALQFRRKEHSVGLPILLGSLGAPLLQLIMLYGHRSADWARFFIYYIPFGFMLCGYLMSAIPLKWRQWSAAGACGLLLSADVVTFSTLQNPVWGHGDHWVVSNVSHNIEFGNSTKQAVQGVGIWPTIMAGKEVANYMAAHPKMRVLISSFTSYAVIPLIHNPAQIVFTADPNFKAVLENPRGRVSAILAPPVNNLTKASDAITRTYPSLWSGGIPWTKFIKQFPGGDRLYAVLPTAP